MPSSPSRTPSRLPKKSSPDPIVYHRRQQEATAARQAVLQSIHHRAKHHVQRAVAVAQDVKQARLENVARREAALQLALHSADQRRANLHSTRIAALSERRAQHARRLREHLRRVEEADQTDAAVDAKAKRGLEAERRRSQILSDRSLRASRFSPPRMSASNPCSPDRMSDTSITTGSSSPRATVAMDRFSVSKDISAVRRTLFPSNVVTQDIPPRKLSHREPGLDVDHVKHKQPAGRPRLQKERRRAAEKIAGCYLLARARVAMTQAGVLGPLLGTYKFADTTARLESDEAQHAADMVFRALGMRNLNRQQTRRDQMREKSECRILLSSLLLALHPDSVVEDKIRHGTNNGDCAASVDTIAVCAARRMLLCLQAGTFRSIAAAWVKWRRVFSVWKKNDAENFLKAMIEDAVATEALRVAIDKKFSEVENLDGFRTSFGVENISADLHRQQHAIWVEQLLLKQEKIRDAVEKLKGSAGIQKLDAALAASRSINDEHLLHEIMVDLTGLLTKVEQSCALPDVVWEQLKADMFSGNPGRSKLAARLAHISKALNSMVPGCFTLSSDAVPGELDVEFAVSIVARVTEALGRCQAEAFDEVVRDWTDEAITRLRSSGTSFCDIIVDVLRELTELVRQVQIAVLSFRIRHSAPVVQEYGSAWERSRFKGHTISGKFDPLLPRTRLLLAESLELLRARTPNVRQELASGAPAALHALMTQAILCLIGRLDICTEDDLPEFLHLDYVRIVTMQNDVQKCSFVGTVGNVARQFLYSKGVASSISNLREMEELVDKEDTRLAQIQDSFVILIQDTLNKSGQVLSQEDTELLRSMVERTTRSGDKTFGLIHRRVEQSLFEKCVERLRRRGPSPNKGKSPSNVMSRDVGLELVQGGIESLSKKMSDLISHVLHVHGETLVGMARCL